MGKLSYETQIYDRLQGKPYLRPVFTSTHEIPERLRAYDPQLFVVLNIKTNRFEIHSLANVGNTFCLAVGMDELDARLLHTVRKCNLKTRGPEIFREIDYENEKLEKSIERKRQNDLMGVAEEMHPYFRDLAWEGV